MPVRSKFDLSNMTGKVAKQLNAAAKRNLLKATVEWHGSVVEELGGPRTGREYKVPGTGSLALVPKEVTIKKGKRAGQRVTIRYNTRVGATLYNASAPGEAPAVRLGQLRQSYAFRVTGKPGNERGEVGSGLDRALWLEEGTKRMAPRPHVEPAFQNRKAQILKHIGQRWDD